MAAFLLIFLLIGSRIYTERVGTVIIQLNSTNHVALRSLFAKSLYQIMKGSCLFAAWFSWQLCFRHWQLLDKAASYSALTQSSRSCSRHHRPTVGSTRPIAPCLCPCASNYIGLLYPKYSPWWPPSSGMTPSYRAYTDVSGNSEKSRAAKALFIRMLFQR